MNSRFVLGRIIVLVGFAIAIQGGSGPMLCREAAPTQLKSSSNTPIVVEPFKLVHDHILVNVKLNGGTSEIFMVDTGATDNVIDNNAAKQLGLQTLHPHERYGAGLGEGKVTLSTVENVSVSISGKEIFRGSATALSLKSFSDARVRIDGILGRPFFKRFVVEIDYAQHILKLYAPQSYEYRGHGEIIRIDVNGDPFIRAELTAPGGDHIKAKLEVDTGGDVVMSLNTPFQSKHSMPRPGQVTVASYGVGTGGDYEGRLGRLEALDIGDFRIAKPLVLFPEVQRGVYTSKKFDGSVGGKLLERFTVIFDYSRKQMILEPNSQFGWPFEANVSGIWFTDLVASANDLAKIKINMSKDSPLVKAGFRQEDKLVAIDGKPTADFTQKELEQLFSEEGKTITVTVERNGKRLDITFTTPKLL